MNYPTGSDLGSESKLPPAGSRNLPDAGPVAVLVSARPDYRYMQSALGGESAKPFYNGSFFNPGKFKGKVSVAGPYIGSPYAVMLMESLVAGGAETILILGWCGSLVKELIIGDILVVSQAVIDEGTSRHYQEIRGSIPSAYPDKTLAADLSQYLKAIGINVKDGTVWTTDGVYRETQSRINQFKGQGAIAVEMECSALFAAARFRGVKAAAVLAVSDSLAEKNWSPGFRRTAFKTARRTICNSVTAYCETII